ncbi:flavin-dependent oxidoreductase [Nonomuraea longicatena]|uniref:Pyocyanin biosynthetic protein PhzM n=1 Tax=Nonomuraea longicatena TaxID=83682 RepID=A0ABN1PH93_9ACTN
MRVLIVGAGIGGLTGALSLHAAGIDCTLVESAAELRPIGVGINLQAHAVRELTELGLADRLAATGIPTSFFRFTDRFGGLIVTMPRGRAAGYNWPQYSIHRGQLQMLLLAAVRDRLGEDAVRTGTAFVSFEQDADGVTASLRDVRSGEVKKERYDVVVGADGINSAVRAGLHPEGDDLRWSGIHMWRGIVESDPILDDSTVLVAGSNAVAKIVVYPVSAEARSRGRALLNWVTEVRLGDSGAVPAADWSAPGRKEDVLPHFADWKHADLDVPALISATEHILSYPMVDRDPLSHWGRGRVTLIGDAAHPLYPIGSNGGSQAVLDARVLARCLATEPTPEAALLAYEAERREPANALVLLHRDLPMDATVNLVTERAPGGFSDITEVLTEEEIRRSRAAQHGLTDQDVEHLNRRASWSVTR